MWTTHHNMTKDFIKRNFILFGAGGHARVVMDNALSHGYKVHAIVAPNLTTTENTFWSGLHALKDDYAIAQFDKADVAMLNGIGQIPNNNNRARIFDFIKSMGFDIPVLRHKSSYVANNVTLQEGAQIMAGSIIQPHTFIGENTVVNSSATIDHDCHIGKNVHIAPSVTICGGVTIGDNSFIGAGATILNNVTLDPKAFIKAGSLVSV
jgi:sugar O-acyltransferase (sialic acid O-acetyltransferase NeuD family)